MGTCTTTRKVPCPKAAQFVQLVKYHDGRLYTSFTLDENIEAVWATISFSSVENMVAFDEDWRRYTTPIVEKVKPKSRWNRFKDMLKSVLK